MTTQTQLSTRPFTADTSFFRPSLSSHALNPGVMYPSISYYRYPHCSAKTSAALTAFSSRPHLLPPCASAYSFLPPGAYSPMLSTLGYVSPPHFLLPLSPLLSKNDVNPDRILFSSSSDNFLPARAYPPTPSTRGYVPRISYYRYPHCSAKTTSTPTAFSSRPPPTTFYLPELILPRPLPGVMCPAFLITAIPIAQQKRRQPRPHSLLVLLRQLFTCPSLSSHALYPGLCAPHFLLPLSPLLSKNVSY